MLTTRDDKLFYPDRTAGWETVATHSRTVWPNLRRLNKDVLAVLQVNNNPPSAVVALRDSRVVKVVVKLGG